MIRVACLLYDDFLLLDAAGPLAAFETARHCGSPGYSVEILAQAGGPVSSSSGVQLLATDFRHSLGFDTLLVPGGIGARRHENQSDLSEFLRHAARDGRRVASVCSGAFLLAGAGILNGRKAATHWAEAPALAQQFPEVEVDAACLFVRDHNIWTSAGVTAGIDLALALIEEDYGAEVARCAAQALVVPFRRSGTQPQHSALLKLVTPGSRFGEVLAWARNHLAEPLSIERLADRASLSSRQFTRAFTASMGVSPAKAIERLRLESARAAIEAGREGFETIARRNGFRCPDSMRRAFIRTYGDTPRTIRQGKNTA